MQSLELRSDGSMALVERTERIITNPDAALKALGFITLTRATNEPQTRLRIKVTPELILSKKLMPDGDVHEAGAIRISSFQLKCHVTLGRLTPKPRTNCDDGEHETITLKHDYFWFGWAHEGRICIVAEKKERGKTRFAAVPIPNAYEDGGLCTGDLGDRRTDMPIHTYPVSYTHLTLPTNREV